MRVVETGLPDVALSTFVPQPGAQAGAFSSQLAQAEAPLQNDGVEPNAFNVCADADAIQTAGIPEVSEDFFATDFFATRPTTCEALPEGAHVQRESSRTEAVLRFIERDAPKDERADQEEHEAPGEQRSQQHFDAPTLQILAQDARQNESIRAPAWMAPIFAKIETWREHQSTHVAQLRLPTEDLGEIHCAIRYNHGVVQVTLSTGSSEARAVLDSEAKRNKQALAQRLAKHGVVLHTLAVH